MHATRRKRLAFLIATRFGGDRQAFMAATEMSKGRVSQLLASDAVFCERAERAIEEKLGLPTDYLDIQDDDPTIWPEDVKRIGRLLLSMSEADRARVLAIVQAYKMA